MTGVPVTSANASHDLKPGLVLDRPEGIEGRDSIGLGVDRAHLGSPARRIAPIEGGYLRFLNASCIGQQIGAQVDSAARGHDPSAEAFAHELRQQAAVVDVGMGQEHGIDVGRAEWKGTIVQCLQRLRSLKQTAVDQQAVRIRALEQIARAGHGAGRTTKPNGHGHVVLSAESAVTDFVAQGGREHAIERDRIGWVRHAVGRTDGANAGADKFSSRCREETAHE